MANQQSKPVSLGYPQIEKLIDSENFEALNKSFGEGYANLEKILGDSSVGVKKQKAAAKAMKAYELTTDLIKELLNIKYELRRLKKEQEKAGQKK